MDLDSTQKNSAPPKLLFDSSEDWLRVAGSEEPDLAIDGLDRTSLIERIFRLIGRHEAS